MDVTQIRMMYANQGDRPAMFLAQLPDGRCLYEYEMPAGSTALVEVEACTCDSMRPCKAIGCHGQGYKKLRTIAYSKVPRYWIKALVDAGTDQDLYFWPQQSTPQQYQAALDRFYGIVKEFLDG